jgi:hypothetical protein
MWWLLTIIFEISISLFIIIYFNRVNSIVSSAYSKDLFKLFIKYSWTLGLFTVIGIIIRLIRNKDSLNSQDKSYQFHNLASSSVQYIKLNLDQKINFLIFMLIISAIFLFSYGLFFFSLLLPLRTIIFGALTQIFGFDFVGLLEQITQVYIPSFNLWLFETFGVNAPQIPNYSHPTWSVEHINKVNEINQLNSELNKISDTLNSLVSSKNTDSLTNSLTHTPDLTTTDAKYYVNSIRAEWDVTSIILFTFGGVCLISSALIYFDSGAYVYASIAHTVHSTGNVIYNTFHSTGSFIYNTGASIYNSFAGLFHSTSASTGVDLIDPNTPSGSSGISRYFGQGDNPVSPSTSSSAGSSASSVGSSSTVKPSGLLVDTKVEPSSSLLTARSNN